MADQEDTETASQDLARIVTNYPHSQYRSQAQALLEQWGKPVPEPDPAKLAEGPPEGKGMVSRFMGFMFGPKIETSSKGVIIDRDLKPEEVVLRAQELAGAPRTTDLVAPGASTSTNASDARPRRATGAGQDVEVKPGSPSNQKEQTKGKDKKSNDKDKDKGKKKNDGATKVLRNP
jgi:hypothetical protein